MERMACPKCGSEYFVSARSGDRVVFQVSDSCEVLIIKQEGRIDSPLLIEGQQIYCGACSWKGQQGDLVESRM